MYNLFRLRNSYSFLDVGKSIKPGLTKKQKIGIVILPSLNRRAHRLQKYVRGI